MRILKVIGKLFLVLLVLAVLAVGLWYGNEYRISKIRENYFKEQCTRKLKFDHDRIEEFDAWLPTKRGEPDMIIHHPDYTNIQLKLGIERDTLELIEEAGPDNPIADHEVFRPSLFINSIFSEDGTPIVIDTSTDELIIVDDVDVNDFLHDGYLYSEVFGVDPDIDLFKDGLSAVSVAADTYCPGIDGVSWHWPDGMPGQIGEIPPW